MAAATAAIIAGTVISAAGQLSAASARKKAAQQNARRARAQAIEDARRSRRRSDALMGRQRAIVAKSGTTMEGSPIQVIEDTAAEAGVEENFILQGGQTRAQAFQQAGRAATQAGFINAGSTLLSGVSRALTL